MSSWVVSKPCNARWALFFDFDECFDSQRMTVVSKVYCCFSELGGDPDVIAHELLLQCVSEQANNQKQQCQGCLWSCATPCRFVCCSQGSRFDKIMPNTASGGSPGVLHSSLERLSQWLKMKLDEMSTSPLLWCISMERNVNTEKLVHVARCNIWMAECEHRGSKGRDREWCEAIECTQFWSTRGQSSFEKCINQQTNYHSIYLDFFLLVKHVCLDQGRKATCRHPITKPTRWLHRWRSLQTCCSNVSKT